MTDMKFVDGLMAKAPHANAPAFVKCSLSIKNKELVAWLQAQEGEWCNVDIKESRGGKWYASVNEFKPDATKASQPASQPTQHPDNFEEDSIPFR